MSAEETPPLPDLLEAKVPARVDVCGAWAKSRGRPCAAPPCRPGARCKVHGGTRTRKAIEGWQKRLAAVASDDDREAVLRELREYAPRSRAAALVLAAQAACVHDVEPVYSAHARKPSTESTTAEEPMSDAPTTAPDLDLSRATLRAIATDAAALPRDRVLASQALHRAALAEERAERVDAEVGRRVEREVEALVARLRARLEPSVFATVLDIMTEEDRHGSR